ncbi:MAG: hypothetical protein WA825_17735 [Steroidobacteraceae bacterium]
MTGKNVQLPLSSDEIRQVIENCSSEAVLVGGQALAIWSEIYGVPPPAELASGISADVDFIGSLRAARVLGKALNKTGGNWTLHEVTPGDFTPQAAKLSLTVQDEGYKEIDFLRAIVGVDTAQARNRAVEMTLPTISRSVKIIHPLDLLASKLHNLASLPEKRDDPGIAQARLAINVVRSFISQAHKNLKEREVFPFVEEVRRIALDKKLDHVYYEYGFDVLAAVPYELFEDENFRSKRWPQIRALVAEQRNKLTR